MQEQPVSVVLVGEVDHGKSSLVGRLLEEAGAIPRSRVEQVQRICHEQGKPFEHAFLLDAFEEEQRQGVTIDVSYFLLRRPGRLFRFIDAPGHREFLKNMVSGSSAADAAILLVDAKEGLREQTRRHAYLLKLLGLEQVLVAINKMDAVDYSREVFDGLRGALEAQLAEIGLPRPLAIPVSAREGDNVTRRLDRTPWHDGPTLLQALEGLHARRPSAEGPLRLPLQDVYKFDERRVLAGRVEWGTLRAGEDVVVWPAGRPAKVATLERWSSPSRPDAVAGESIGITLAEQIFAERGSVVARPGQSPTVTTTLDASLFWMGKAALKTQQPLRLKLLSQEAECRITRIHRLLDTSNLAMREPGAAAEIGRHEVAEVTIQLARPIVLDAFGEVPPCGRFVLAEHGQVCGGGIVTRAESASATIKQPKSRDLTWEFSSISPAERWSRNGHRGAVVWLTGLSGAGKSTVARLLEAELFHRGCQVFVLDGDNVRHGLNADLDFSSGAREENIRRVGEVAKLFAEAGMIVITAFISPFRAGRDQVRAVLPADGFFEVYLRCPLEVCEARDAKGLYKKARAGLLPDFTGISSPFEEPKAPELVLDSAGAPAPDCAQNVLRLLEARGVLRG